MWNGQRPPMKRASVSVWNASSTCQERTRVNADGIAPGPTSSAVARGLQWCVVNQVRVAATPHVPHGPNSHKVTKEDVSMSLVRWIPRRNVALNTELDRLFDGFFNPTPLRSDWGALSPAVDVEETADAYVFRADLPGIPSKDVKVTVHNDTLTLRGERKRETEKSDGSMHRVERAYGSFERSFTLGLPVRADQVRASYKDGVLEVHVPKADEAKPRDIEVQIN